MTHEYITQEQAVDIAMNNGSSVTQAFSSKTKDLADLHQLWPNEIQSICKAAIQHYLDSLGAELPEPVAKLIIEPCGDSGIGIEFLIDCPEERLNVGEEVFTRHQLLAAIAKERAKRVEFDRYYAVESDNGTMDVFVGSKKQCEVVRQALQTACLDGAFMASRAAAPTQEAL